MIRITLTFTILSVLLLACEPQKAPVRQNADIDALYEGLEFEMPKVYPPVFPDYQVSIVDFGAVSDGVSNNQKAINQAIADVSAKGGGTVLVPRGVWLTGPITMKSNVNLYTEANALVLFSEDFDLYPLVETSFEGLDTWRCLSPINGKGLENIAFTGAGTFDGNGDAWRYVKRSKMTERQWKMLLSKGGVLSEDGLTWYPSEKSRNGRDSNSFNVPDFDKKEDFEAIKDFLRPVMVSLVQCKNVMLDGPTFQNSPAWNIHPLMCENVIIRNLNIRNPWYSQNGDGVDLESCKNSLIYNNTFDVGDDAICIKSGKDQDGRDRGMPTENAIIKNNMVYHGHGGFVVGSEMSGGVKNMHVSNCTFMGTDIGLRFKSTRGRGGVVENIYISNIDMIDIPTEAIRFNLFYGGQSPIVEEDQEESNKDPEVPAEPVTEETPSFRDIYIRDVTATNSAVAGFFQGLPEMNLKNINLENVYLQTKKGISCIDVDGLSFKHVKVENEKGSPLTIYNGKHVAINESSFQARDGRLIRVQGSKTADLQFGLEAEELEISSEVSKTSVITK